MMSELPISCFRCRRRKIKCNKRKPCNQCTKQTVPCQFPTKFRNVSYDSPEKSGSSTLDSIEHGKLASPSDISKLEEQVRRLELENQYIREEFQRKLWKAAQDLDLDHSSTGLFQINGETTEKGEKYYGPLSSNNMTEDFDKILSNYNKMDSVSSLKHHLWTRDPFKIAGADNDSGGSEVCYSQLAQKRPLPWLALEGETAERNMQVLKALVRHFFDTKTYNYFISKGRILHFLDEHALIPDLTWENCDDLLLLHMILITSVQRLNPTKYNELFLPKVASFQQMWKANRPIKKRLFHGFSKLRHNLLNESFVTVQAYILCTEWEFMEQRYEESWLMMFHCCSIAYALGLHVVSKPSELSFESLVNSNQGLESALKDSCDDYFTDKLPKLRVWFALQNLNSQMCSILGRPNPIMIQVSQVSLPVTSISNVEDAQRLNNLTNLQLKLGLSECIRLLNSSMIDSFLKKVSMDNVWAINLQFSEQIDKLSYYLSPQYENLIDGVVKKIDTLTDKPTTVTRKDILIDLVVLHVNRVKLLEPFLDQLPPSRPALNYIMGSIILFYEHTCELVSEFVKKQLPRILESDEAKEGEIRLDKVFIYKDPFFASFIYQGIVVTFILISLKANDFILENNGHFISQVEGHLHMLLGLHSSISKLVKENIHLWSRNNIFLMKKVLDHIGIMKQALKDYKANGQMTSSFGGFEYDPQVAEMLGNNLRDPFWVVNPENSPNFLGISEDQEDSSSLMNNNGTNVLINNPQERKLCVSNYTHFNSTANEKMQVPHLHNNAHMSLFGSDPMMDGAHAQYNRMLVQGNFVDTIDIDEDGSVIAQGRPNKNMNQQ